MSEFTAGLAMRLDAAAQALHAAFTIDAANDFAPSDIRERLRAPSPPASGFAAERAQPRSFSPADRDHNPTAGWDPFAAAEPQHQFIDPLAAAHAAGYAEGLAAAIAEGKARDGQSASLLARLGEALRAEERLDRAALADQLRQTVMFLVTKVVGEAGVSADLLTARIAAATELLADAAESALLRVHPDDVALVEGRLPGSVFPVGDAGVARGSFVLESASTLVEDGPTAWLDQLAAAMDRVAVPC